MAIAAEYWGESVLVERSRRIAVWLPVLAIAYPVLVWPIIEPPQMAAHADLAPPTMSELGILNRIYFPPLFLAGVACFLIQARVYGVTLLRTPIVLSLLYVLWALVGTVWAIEPDLVFRRSLLQFTIIGAVMLPAIAARSPQAILDRLFWLFALVGLINLGAVILYPPGPIGHEGIYTHKNMLGGVSATLFLFALFQAFSGGGALRRLLAIGMCVVGLILLLASDSKTSLGLSIMIPVAAFLLAFLARTFRLSPAFMVPLGFGILGLVYWIGVRTYIWDFESVATFIFGDPTLTRRTEIWDFAFKMIERRPWVGFGYESFWGVSFESPSVREAPGFIAKLNSGHNGFIDLVVQTGFIGLALAMASILALLHACGRIARYSMAFGTTLIALTLSYIFYNVTESIFFHSFDQTHLIFLTTLGLAASAYDVIEGRTHG